MSSAEAMKALRVTATTLDLLRPPRPSGNTELRAKGWRLEVSFPRAEYLQNGDKADFLHNILGFWKCGGGGKCT